MRLHRVAQTVDGLDRRIGRRVIADGIIGAADVIVDRCGDTNNGNAVLRQLQQTAERAIAAHSDNAFQPQQLTGRNRLLLAFLRREFVAARRIENGAAAIDDVRDAVGVQLDKISVDQTVVAAADADAVDPEQIRCTYHCAHRCVHAGRVTAGGQYADPFYGITHKSTSFQIKIFFIIAWVSRNVKLFFARS